MGSLGRCQKIYDECLHPAGLYYAADIAGSDIMRHPEAHNNQLGRHIPEGLYRNGTEVGNYNLLSYQKEGTDGAYGALFDVIGKCNAITSAFEEEEGFNEMMAQTKPTDESQIYGEAVALRATCYRELIKYFGDVPCPAEFGKPAGGIPHATLSMMSASSSSRRWNR